MDILPNAYSNIYYGDGGKVAINVIVTNISSGQDKSIVTVISHNNVYRAKLGDAVNLLKCKQLPLRNSKFRVEALDKNITYVCDARLGTKTVNKLTEWLETIYEQL